MLTAIARLHANQTERYIPSFKVLECRRVCVSDRGNRVTKPAGLLLSTAAGQLSQQAGGW